MNMRWFLRMAKWARRPPSENRVKLVFLVLMICLILFGYERFFGWPDWMTLEGSVRGRLGR